MIRCRWWPILHHCTSLSTDEQRILFCFSVASDEDKITDVKLLGQFPSIVVTIARNGVVSLLDVLKTHVVAQIVLPQPYLFLCQGMFVCVFLCAWLSVCPSVCECVCFSTLTICDFQLFQILYGFYLIVQRRRFPRLQPMVLPCFYGESCHVQPSQVSYWNWSERSQY